MKQVIQNFKTGELSVEDVPPPSLSRAMVLVENKYSLISAGTERGTVKVAKASLLGKARQRPDLVAQVMQNIKKEGLKATLEKVRTKLDSLKALGYSTSGTVLGSMDTDSLFKPGDRVACAGQDYASHAELVTVPQNLVVKIPGNVTFEEASFTTLGAIAMQGIRQADPKLGESVAVIGLGLLGQLTCQLLKANGCTVFGIDLSPHLVKLAKELGADHAMRRDDTDLLRMAESFTKGYGFDSVIITAATTSNDPIELSAEIARTKGKVIAVGAVGLNVPRDPHFYRKELDLRLSCSYGPGRYDFQYEENGQDYPYGYVRWTEKRNMEAFLQLASQGKLKLKELITHVFDITEAERAYDIVMGKITEPHIAILLSYTDRPEKFATSYKTKAVPPGIKAIHAGFIGAGSFAQSYLIPHVKNAGASLQTVVTSRGITAKNVADKFGFALASSDPADIFNDKEINTVFIATPHHSHANYVLSAWKADKKVFVEKPLAMTVEELEELKNYHDEFGGTVMVGFNRRYSPAAVKLKEAFGKLNEPLMINYRINAGYIPKEHWTQNEQIGGGRIIGELCHFIDLMQYFTGSLPVTVYAQALADSNHKSTNADNLSVIIRFRDSSVGTITYVANGDKSMPKEKVEIFGGGKAGVINDFRNAELFASGKNTLLKLAGKGHQEEVHLFVKSLLENRPAVQDFISLYATTMATFKILDSLATGLPQLIEI